MKLLFENWREYLNENYSQKLKHLGDSDQALRNKWAVKMKKDDFIGKKALETELENGPEWKFVGIEIQWDQLENH